MNPEKLPEVLLQRYEDSRAPHILDESPIGSPPQSDFHEQATIGIPYPSNRELVRNRSLRFDDTERMPPEEEQLSYKKSSVTAQEAE